jgi:hypothetical protein
MKQVAKFHILWTLLKTKSPSHLIAEALTNFFCSTFPDSLPSKVCHWNQNLGKELLQF